MKYSHIICHYSEIGLKGKNRPFFVKTLQKNIRYAVNQSIPELVKDVEKTHDRLIISLNEGVKESYDLLFNTLKEVFGIAYFCPVFLIDNDLDSMKSNAINILKKEDFKSFRVTARMSKSVSLYSKMYVHEHIGLFIQSEMKKDVNLKHPDITCYIDTIKEGTFIYSKKIKGMGGMPVGSGGKGVFLLSGGIDSPVAAFYMIKRGMVAIYVHFHSLPQVSPASIEKVKDLVKILSKYQKRPKLILVPFLEIQEEILEKTSDKYRLLLYRRMMLKIANIIALNERAKGLITGEALGQVASQTVENLGAVDTVSKLPVFRPLIGLDKQEIINTGKKINTYSISIRPHEDCCTLFLPQNPATKATPEQLDIEEKKIDLQDKINRAIDNSDYIYF